MLLSVQTFIMVDSRAASFVLIWTCIFYGKIPQFLCDATYYSSYVNECDYEGARNASKHDADSVFKHNEVHGGFFTVNKKLNINLYSLLVKSAKDWQNAPLIVWIQGQPACTALYAVFGQNGPYRVADDDLSLIKNEYAWTDEFNVLYLDNMIYTGYSYAHNTSNVIAYLHDMGSYLYDALYQFYQVFSALTVNDLYLAGEMYAGKYLLQLGHAIHKRNPISHVKMRLKGIYIGSGFTDPENMLEYSALMYQVGLIDYTKMKQIQNMEESIRKGIRSQKYDIAQQQLLSVWIEMQLAGFDFPMDFTRPNVSFSARVFDYLASMEFRTALDLRNFQFYSQFQNVIVDETDRTLKNALELNALKTVKNLLPALLAHYRILYYAGQFDLLVPYVHVTNFLRLLEWEGAELYYNAIKTPRYQWTVDDELAGYWKNAQNLTEVLVRNASQMVDASQPKWGLNLLRMFVNNDFRGTRIPVNGNSYTTVSPTPKATTDTTVSSKMTEVGETTRNDHTVTVNQVPTNRIR